MAELGTGGGSDYPGVLDTDGVLEQDGVHVARADVPNDLARAIVRIETELGTDPAGVSADLKTRLGNVLAAQLAQLETLGATTISAAQWGMLGASVEWTDWVPTLTGGADLSGYNTARYYRIGNICFFQFVANVKNVTTVGEIQITLPFTTANTDKFVPSGVVNDGTNWIGFPHITIEQNANYFSVYKTAAVGNWAGTENGISIRVTGFFEIA